MSVKQHQLEANDAESRFREVHEKYRQRLLNSMTAVVRDRQMAEDIYGHCICYRLLEAGKLRRRVLTLHLGLRHRIERCSATAV